jgi:leucyl-tRNA synthetase
MLLLLAPMAPHITAELWERRHPGSHVHEQVWPVAEEALAAVETVTMMIQVDGKVVDRIEVEPSTSEDEAAALALTSDKVQAALGGAAPSRVVSRPPRVVNLVR